MTSSNKTPRPFVREVIRSRSSRKAGLLAPSTLSWSSDRPAGVLALVRHGESEFNKQDRFTGLKNPDLTPHGIQEAIKAGRTLHQRGFHCDSAYTSKLKRAQQSLRLILRELRDGFPANLRGGAFKRARLWGVGGNDQGRRPRAMGRGEGPVVATIIR